MTSDGRDPGSGLSSVVQRLRDRFQSSFLLLPASMTAGIGLLAALLTWADAALWESGVRFGFAGEPAAARGLLSTIASSTLTLAGLTFSVTLVVLALASSQYSPRVLRTFLKDRRTKMVLGVFLGTYVYALVTLRAVRSADEAAGQAAFVPGVAMTVAFVFALAAIGVFVFFIDHVVQSVRIERIIGRIAADTRGIIERWYPLEQASSADASLPGTVASAALDTLAADGRATRAITAATPGVVSSIDSNTLVERARAVDGLVVVQCGVGQFVPEGGPLVTVIGTDDDLDPDAFRGPIALSATRTETQDVGFGLRQLVDIAERALSPGVNDTTTAVQAVDQIHDLLRRLATRPIPDGRHVDADGILRVQVPVASWGDLVALALDEIRHWGANSLQIAQRLHDLLDDLLTVVSDDRAEPLHRQRRLLVARLDDELPDVEQAQLH